MIKINSGTELECQEKYPYIGKSRLSGNVYLVLSSNTAVALEINFDESFWRVGEYSKNFTETSITPIQGKITIENIS